MGVATAQTLLSVKDRLTPGLKRGLASIKKFGSRVASGMKVAAKSMLVVGAAAGVVGAAFLKMFADAEKSQARLEAVIKATGGAAGFTAEQIHEMAGAYQTLTGISDEVVKDGQAILLTFKEIRGDEFKRATTAMLDMAAVMGGDAKAQAVQLGKALNDPIKGVAALNRVGVQFTDAQKEQIKTMQESGDIMGAQGIILAELEGQFGGTAEAIGDKFGGRVNELIQRLGDLGEQIGGALVPSAEWLIDVVGQLTGFIEDNMDAIKEWIGWIGDLGRSLGEWLVDKLTTLIEKAIWVFTFYEQSIKNWRDTVDFVMSDALLHVVKFVNQLSHFFTEVVPANLRYLGSVFLAFGKTYFDFWTTLYSNIWKNTLAFFKGLWNLIKGKDANWQWTGLLDGFNVTVAKMTKVADRIPSALEKALKKQMAEAGGRLGTSVGEAAERRIKKLRDALSAIRGGLTLAERRAAAKEQLEGITAGEGGTARAVVAGKTKSEKKKDIKASFEGLAESWRRITQAASTTDPSKKDIKRTAVATEKTAKATEKEVKVADKQTKILEEIRELSRAGFVSAGFGV